MKRTLLYLLLLPALLSGTCLLAAGPAGNAGHGAKPCLRRLTCEGLTDPLAIDTATPRFGWQLRSGRRGDAQRSYRIEVACGCWPETPTCGTRAGYGRSVRWESPTRGFR